MKAYFFLRENGRAPVEEYLETIRDKRQLVAIQAVIEKLIERNGRLPRQLAAYIKESIWELRARYGGRVFFFIQDGTDIILLDGYTKKRDRIEKRVLKRVLNLYAEYRQTKKRKPF